MKKALLLISMFLITITVAFAAAVPDSVNLKDTWDVDGKQKAVIFDHAHHSTKNDCTECHDSADGGAFKPSGEIKGNNQKNAAHDFCWTCHTNMNVKQVGKTCTKCHKG